MNRTMPASTPCRATGRPLYCNSHPQFRLNWSGDIKANNGLSELPSWSRIPRICGWLAGWLAGTLENQLMVVVSAICAFSTWFWFLGAGMLRETEGCPAYIFLVRPCRHSGPCLVLSADRNYCSFGWLWVLLRKGRSYGRILFRPQGAGERVLDCSHLRNIDFFVGSSHKIREHQTLGSGSLGESHQKITPRNHFAPFWLPWYDAMLANGEPRT
jgi:hypothetical protein